MPNIARVNYFTRKTGYVITIDNSNNPNELTDYQVMIDFSGDDQFFADTEGKREAIRFYDENWNKIPYWIEEWDPTNEIAKVWVKVPKIPANGKATIYMDYDTTRTTDESDGSSTFEFFDDFITDTLSLYTIIGGSWVIEDGYLKSNSSSDDNWIAYQGKTFDRPIAVRAKMETGNNDTGVGFIWGSSGGGEGSVSGYIANYYTSTSYSNLRKYSNGSSTNLADLPALSAGVFWTFEMKLGESSIIVTRDGNTDAEATDTTYSTLNGVGFRIKDDIRRIDWIAVRKYTEPEPTVSYEKGGMVTPKENLLDLY